MIPPIEKRQHRPVAIDFVAAYSLEDCAYRLGQLHDRRALPFVPPVQVRLICLDDDTWAFQLRETQSAPVTIHGFLNRLHHDSTYISGVAVINRYRLYADAVIGLAIISGLALIVGLVVAVLYVPILLYLIQRYWRASRAELLRLTRLIGDVLVS